MDMQRLIKRTSLTAWLLMAIGWLVGCGLDAGLNRVPEVSPSTSIARTELEFIPDAVLVREDMMPRWAGGRFAFRTGGDRLLVLTRLTSFAKIDPKTKEELSRWDAKMERMWITIPHDATVGQELDLDDLEWNRLLGYDCGDVGDGQFAQPYRASGKVAILEEKADSIQVFVNILVSPNRQPNWSAKGVYDVPRTLTGIYGQSVSQGPKQGYESSRRSGDDQAAALPGSLRDRRNLPPASTVSPASALPASKPASSEERPSPQAVRPEPVLTTQPATGPAATLLDDGRRLPSAAAANHQLMGRWESQTPRGYDRIQFENDGTFVYASAVSGGYEPAVHQGVYEQRGDFLLLKTERYAFGSVNHPNLSNELPKPVVTLMKMTWDGSELILTGQMFRRGSLGAVTLRLESAKYQDMRIVSPPRMQ